MKATEFVKQHGIEKAREVVDSAPESSTLVFYHFDVINNELLGPEYYRDGGSQHFDKDNKSWGFCVDPQTRVAEPHDALESLCELKRLIESHELVNHMGGLEKAMDAVINQEANGRNMTQLAQAIADVEACQ